MFERPLTTKQQLELDQANHEAREAADLKARSPATPLDYKDNRVIGLGNRFNDGKKKGEPAIFEPLEGQLDYSKDELIRATEQLECESKRTAEDFRSELTELAAAQDFPGFRKLANLRIAGFKADADEKTTAIRRLRASMSYCRGENQETQDMLKNWVSLLCGPNGE